METIKQLQDRFIETPDTVSLEILVAIAAMLMPGIDVWEEAIASLDDTDYSLRYPTRAMHGNDRRQKLMAKVQARTRVIKP